MKRFLLFSVLFPLGLCVVFAIATFPSLSQTPSTTLEPIPVIVDDDGSADGMIGLAYVLQDPKFQVKAITIAQGLAHPDVFAPNMTRMLARLGRTGIPIAAGRLSPLAGSNAFPEAWRAETDQFWGITLPDAVESVESISAAQLIVEVVKQSPQPVTILAIGPLTNLAEALRLDSSIVSKIRIVEIMGGAVYVPGNIKAEWPEIDNTVAEWNIWVDPVGANEVFSAGFPIRLVPLDATNQVVMTAADAAAWRASGTAEGKLAAELLESLLKAISPTGVSVWDAVAAVDMSVPELCEGKQVHIDVITKSGSEQGRTVASSSQPTNVSLCLYPKIEQIKVHISEILGKR